MFRLQALLFHLLLFFYIISVASCTSKQVNEDPLAFIKDEQAGQLLHKAIQGSGGMENWERLKSMKFQKEYALYLENGELESDAKQEHKYTLGKDPQVSIKWETDGQQHEIDFKNKEVMKRINGVQDTSYDMQRAMNTVLSSTFVMQLPYNLIDPTANIKYSGSEQLMNGAKVEVLEVSYDPKINENHSTPDIWWLYFAEKDGALLGYKVKHADHYSYVENIRTEKVNGLLMPVNRKSWRVDSEGNRKYLRAAYIYKY